ncbi:hypothetical protein ACSQ67_018810 [Phaseolus vulgaris]
MMLNLCSPLDLEMGGKFNLDALVQGHAGTPNPGDEPVVVEHHQPQSSNTQDGGWIARIAALLVGEDPAQSDALLH